MIGSVTSCAVVGVVGLQVRVEVDIAPGLPSYQVVGLPAAAVREGASRIRAALHNIGHALPAGRITINLAPGDRRKEGASLDLPIALALMVAQRQLPQSVLKEQLFWGELGLDGRLRGHPGALSVALLAKALGKQGVILPTGCEGEAALVDGLEVRGARTLGEVVDHLRGQSHIAPSVANIMSAPSAANGPDYADVVGQAYAKSALEIAAAGGHNILLVGPPGVGKSMLASRLPTILPPMSRREQLEVAQVRSAANAMIYSPLGRPFRAPHHTISKTALTGGGSIPRPGELSMAHNGVLYLDEIIEFPRHVLESMRQPLENGEITIDRSWGSLTLPARFMLVGTANPCPCGWLGSSLKMCRCSGRQLSRYQARLSGPLLDRIDMRISLSAPRCESVVAAKSRERSQCIQERVVAARDRQRRRYRDVNFYANGTLPASAIQRYCHLTQAAEQSLTSNRARFELFSVRAIHRVIRVARTIADLSGSDSIGKNHILEALAYRLTFSKLSGGTVAA